MHTCTHIHTHTFCTHARCMEEEGSRGPCRDSAGPGASDRWRAEQQAQRYTECTSCTLTSSHLIILSSASFDTLLSHSQPASFYFTSFFLLFAPPRLLLLGYSSSGGGWRRLLVQQSAIQNLHQVRHSERAHTFLHKLTHIHTHTHCDRSLTHHACTSFYYIIDLSFSKINS